GGGGGGGGAGGGRGAAQGGGDRVGGRGGHRCPCGGGAPGVQPIAGRPRAGSSTRQSLARGAPSLETDYLNGEISLVGRLHGVPTPVNDALCALSDRHLRERRPPQTLPAEEVLERARARDYGDAPVRRGRRRRLRRARAARARG